MREWWLIFDPNAIGRGSLERGRDVVSGVWDHWDLGFFCMDMEYMS